MTYDPIKAREKLQERIAELDKARGRPLTEREKLANLRRWLDARPPSP